MTCYLDNFRQYENRRFLWSSCLGSIEFTEQRSNNFTVDLSARLLHPLFKTISRYGRHFRGQYRV